MAFWEQIIKFTPKYPFVREVFRKKLTVSRRREAPSIHGQWHLVVVDILQMSLNRQAQRLYPIVERNTLLQLDQCNVIVWVGTTRVVVVVQNDAFDVNIDHRS